MELNGHEFPFSRGASFYEVTEQGQILYGRDLVEPALKPGSSALLVSFWQLQQMINIINVIILKTVPPGCVAGVLVMSKPILGWVEVTGLD